MNEDMKLKGNEPAVEDVNLTGDEANPNANVGGTNGDGRPEAGIDIQEAQRIAKARSQRAENAALKSYFKQQGLSEEQGKEALEAYKAQLAQQEEAERNNLTYLQQKVATYEQNGTEALRQAKALTVEAAATIQALGMDVKPDRINYAIRMADLSQVAVDENGKADEEAIREALTQVVKDIPELTNQKAEERAGFKVGAPGQQEDKAVTSKLASIFGVEDK